MLRSVGELLRYIDENHLASDFAAKVEYCQSDWIVLRTVAPPVFTAGLSVPNALVPSFVHSSAGHRDLCSDGEGDRSGAAGLRLRTL